MQAQTNAVALERRAFAEYTEAIGGTVGHDASAKRARAACPGELTAWREAFALAYGCDPDESAQAHKHDERRRL
jgi:hypothetical protein